MQREYLRIQRGLAVLRGLFLLFLEFLYLELIGLYLVLHALYFYPALIELELHSFYVICKKQVAFFYLVALFYRERFYRFRAVVFIIYRFLSLDNA